MAELEQTRVVIVDDQVVVLRGISVSMLAYDDIKIVAEATSGEEAVAVCEKVQPDVVLMDLLMTGMGGVAAIQELRERCPDAQVVALTSFQDGNLVQEALQAGATGYLLKDIAIDELVKAVRLAHRGMPTLSPVAAQALVHTVAAHMPRIGHDLTDREREVLGLLAEGYSNQRIAEQMVITPATVKFHMRGIRSKLGTSSRTETVLSALQHHLVPAP